MFLREISYQLTSTNLSRAAIIYVLLIAYFTAPSRDLSHSVSLWASKFRPDLAVLKAPADLTASLSAFRRNREPVGRFLRQTFTWLTARPSWVECLILAKTRFFGHIRPDPSPPSLSVRFFGSQSSGAQPRFSEGPPHFLSLASGLHLWLGRPVSFDLTGRLLFTSRSSGWPFTLINKLIILF